MPHIPLSARHRGSSACGVTPQDAPRAAYHTRSPDRAPDREGKRGVPWLHTRCGVRYAMPHRVSTPPEQGSPRYGGDRIASIRIDGMDPSSCTPTRVSVMMKVGGIIAPYAGGST